MSVKGEKTGVPGSMEINVGLDVGGMEIMVSDKGDHHSSNGGKTPTINVFKVDIHAAPVAIMLDTGIWGTLVPTAEKGRKGPEPGDYHDKTGTCLLLMVESTPNDAKAFKENSPGKEGEGPKTVTLMSDGGCTGTVV